MSPAVRTTIEQADFSDGMVRGVAPALISANGVFDLVDVLLDEDGSPYRRGGTAYKSKAGLGSSGLRWIWDGYLNPGARTIFANASDFGVLGSDDQSVVNLGGAGLTVPKQSAVLEDLLFVGGGTLYGGSRKEAVYNTGTVKVVNGSKTVVGSGTTWNTLVDSGMLFHRASERVYVVASIDTTASLTLRDPYQGETGEGKSYSLNPTWTIGGTDPYDTFDYVTVCANRLVGLSGRTLKFTEIRNPHSYTNQFSTTNEHTLPEGVEGVGLATVGQTVLIFTTAGIWVLDGLALDIVDQNGNPQHRIQQLASGTALAGAQGLAGSGQQIVVPATDGIFLMDGVSQPVRISRPIEQLYRERIAAGYRLGKAAVYRGHYLLPITKGSDVKDLFVCRLDRPTRSRGQTAFPWSRFSGDGGEITAFAVRAGVGPTEPILLGAQARSPSRVVSCSSYFSPDDQHENDADGSTHNFDLTTRDHGTGNGTINMVRAVKPRYELSGKGDPKLTVSYNPTGARTGAPKFGSAIFGEAEFGGKGSATFIPIGEVGESNGRDPARLRLNKKMRFARLRIKSSGPAAICVLRSYELTIRPSGATRR